MRYQYEKTKSTSPNLWMTTLLLGHVQFTSSILFIAPHHRLLTLIAAYRSFTEPFRIVHHSILPLTVPLYLTAACCILLIYVVEMSRSLVNFSQMSKLRGNSCNGLQRQILGARVECWRRDEIKVEWSF